MIIHRDCFVKLAYRLHLESGEYIRGSAEQPEILIYIAGYKELLPALENRLLGLKPGDESEFVIPALRPSACGTPGWSRSLTGAASPRARICAREQPWSLTLAPLKWSIPIKWWK